MAKSYNRLFEPVLPSAEEALMAKEVSRQLAGSARTNKPLPMQISAKKKSEEILLPASAVQLLMRILNEMAQGNAITIFPQHAELTTQQAADVLSVSRPFLVKLVEQRKLPCKKVGRHRRIRFEDLMECKRKMELDREKALAELAAEAQELDMGY